MKPVDVRQLLKKIHSLVNIEWLYETEVPSPGVTVAPPPGNSTLPVDCDIDELINLGEIGHVSRILKRLTEIESGSPECREFVARMRAMVNAFDFKRYASALEEVRGAHA